MSVHIPKEPRLPSMVAHPSRVFHPPAAAEGLPTPRGPAKLQPEMLRHALLSLMTDAQD